MNTGLKSPSASACRSSSTRTLDSAYGVTGRSGASSADQVVAAGGAVDRAGRRVQEAPHSGVAGQPGQPYGRVVVDVVGEVRRQRSQRVVGQRGQVDHGVHPGHVFGRDVAQVHPVPRRVRGRRAEHAVGEQAGVEADDLVPGGREDRGHDGAQVALVSGQ